MASICGKAINERVLCVSLSLNTARRIQHLWNSQILASTAPSGKRSKSPPTIERSPVAPKTMRAPDSALLRSGIGEAVAECVHPSNRICVINSDLTPALAKRTGHTASQPVHSQLPVLDRAQPETPSVSRFSPRCASRKRRPKRLPLSSNCCELRRPRDTAAAVPLGVTAMAGFRVLNNAHETVTVRSLQCR